MWINRPKSQRLIAKPEEYGLSVNYLIGKTSPDTSHLSRLGFSMPWLFAQNCAEYHYCLERRYQVLGLNGCFQWCDRIVQLKFRNFDTTEFTLCSLCRSAEGSQVSAEALDMSEICLRFAFIQVAPTPLLAPTCFPSPIRTRTLNYSTLNITVN